MALVAHEARNRGAAVTCAEKPSAVASVGHSPPDHLVIEVAGYKTNRVWLKLLQETAWNEALETLLFCTRCVGIHANGNEVGLKESQQTNQKNSEALFAKLQRRRETCRGALKAAANKEAKLGEAFGIRDLLSQDERERTCGLDSDQIGLFLRDVDIDILDAHLGCEF